MVEFLTSAPKRPRVTQCENHKLGDDSFFAKFHMNADMRGGGLSFPESGPGSTVCTLQGPGRDFSEPVTSGDSPCSSGPSRGVSLPPSGGPGLHGAKSIDVQITTHTVSCDNADLFVQGPNRRRIQCQVRTWFSLTRVGTCSLPGDLCRDAMPLDICTDTTPIDLSRDATPIDLCKATAPIDLCRDPALIDLCRDPALIDLCRDPALIDLCRDAAGMQHPLTCVGLQHPLTCTGMQHPLTCTEMQ